MPAFARRSSRLILIVAVVLGVAACEGKQERAERHYQRGLELAASGEIDRAMIEFRNVFRLDATHGAARLSFARLLRDRGETAEALEQYRILTDQDRASLAGHLELAELALRVQDFGTAAGAAGRAFDLAPEDPAARALKATFDYRDGAHDAARAMARDVLAEAPGDVAARMVLIADRMNTGDAAGALAQADAGLAVAPGDEGLHLVRLAALEQTGDAAGVGDQLARMAGLFPDNPGISRALVQWHLRQGDPGAAEAVLRGRADRSPDAAGPALTVVQFLYETAGADAARTELDRLIAGAATPLPFRRALAGLDFAEGRHAAAAAMLRTLVDGAPASDETRDIQIELAAMLEAGDDPAGRDALIEAVLDGDPGHVAALKMRARARIAADQPERAIQDMRLALAQAPRDPEVMTIMATAHEREGAHDLAGERLALAAEVSGRAPQESLRYARFLMEEGRVTAAEGVITDALRRAEDPDLLMALGRIHLDRRDWRQAQQVAQRLRALTDPATAETAAGMATDLETALLAGQDRAGEAIEALRGQAAAGDDAAAMTRLVQAYVAAGDLAAAQAHLDGVLASDPASLPGRLMQAALLDARGRTADAETLYRTLVAEAPSLPRPHRALFALLAGQGQTAAADAALADGIAATGGDAELMFLQAGLLESRGDVEGAIAVYETLYARDSASPLLANNLASLLTTHRSDPESLQRAFTIARRLRSSDVPYFQDTYGWILHRRGESRQALEFLEPAAAALVDNAQVQFHLGEALLALDRVTEARTQFRRAVDLAPDGPAAASPQIAAARARLAEIAARPPDPVDATPDG